MAVAPAVIAGVSIAASAAGTVATISAQQKQARAQEEMALSSALDAEERAELAITRNEQLKQIAKMIRDRELAMVSEQRKQAQLAIKDTELANQLSQIQSGLQSSTLRQQGEGAALGAQGEALNIQGAASEEAFNRESAARNQQLGRGNELIGAINEQTQTGLANANQIAGTRQGFDQAGTLANQQLGANSDAAMGLQQRATGQAYDQYGRALTNAQQSRGMAGFNAQMARQNFQLAAQQLGLAQSYGQSNQGLANQYAAIVTKMGQNQKYMSGLGAAAIDINQAFQNQQVALGNQYQHQINAVQTKRNKQAIKAGYQSSLATGNIGALSAVMQEKANIAEALAQANMARASAPSGLAAFGAIAGGISSAYQSGLFNSFGGSKQQPQQSGLINFKPPSTVSHVQWGQSLPKVSHVQWGQPLPYGK